MTPAVRILLIIGAVMVFYFVLRKVRREKIEIEQSIFWILFAAILVIIGVFPQIVYFVSNILGIISPVNIVFLIIICVLIIKMFLMTIQISHLQEKINCMAQKIAIEEKEENK